jgi:hypothetical protein
MMNKTQERFITEELMTQGYVTRNFALKHYISRLGAIICNLKNKGWNIEGRNLKTEFGIDYIYRFKGINQTKLF